MSIFLVKALRKRVFRKMNSLTSGFPKSQDFLFVILVSELSYELSERMSESLKQQVPWDRKYQALKLRHTDDFPASES